jgi:hypothetical protein
MKSWADFIVYIKEKDVCNQGYGCDCDKLHLVNCKNGLTIIAIGWTRGNKKALATILPTNYWNKLRALLRFDYSAHKNSKKDSRRAYRVYGIISKPVTKGDSTQILKTASSYFLIFALVKFENDASIFTCEMFVAKILGKKV